MKHHATIYVKENRVVCVRFEVDGVRAIASDNQSVTTFKDALIAIAQMARNLKREITWTVKAE
jgi:hypothetical protein